MVQHLSNLTLIDSVTIKEDFRWEGAVLLPMNEKNNFY